MSLPQFEEEIVSFEEPMVFGNDLRPCTIVNTSCSNRRASMQEKLPLGGKFECGEEQSNQVRLLPAAPIRHLLLNHPSTRVMSYQEQYR